MNKRIDLKYLIIDDLDFTEIKTEITKDGVLNQTPKVVMTPNAGHLKEIMTNEEIKKIPDIYKKYKKDILEKIILEII